MLGKIHSIETFGTVDGPGIRFVIFMQGCHLQCKYCHNRDTWNLNSGNDIKPSGGGITVTGGEPLLQTKFLIELFTKLKDLDFHTAIDTSRNVYP